MLRLLAWFLIAFVLLVCWVVVKFILDTYDVKLWPIIRRARREIGKIACERVPHAKVFSSQGPTAVNPGYLGFCIRVRTDKERDFLCEDPEIPKLFSAALAKAGYPTTTNPVVHFSIQSQETVDRDYGGSWDEAGRMPKLSDGK
jgi:hypothetical protein